MQLTDTTTKGGSREGAGRKPGGYVKPQEAVDFDKAKARSETAKANKMELEYKIQTGKYVPRAVVQQVTATAYAALAQTMRSIGDNLERQGVPLDVCAKVEAILNEGMEDHAKTMAMFAGTEDHE